MPLPAQFAHLVVKGTLPGGEVFAWGWWHTESEFSGGWSQDHWDTRVAQYETALRTGDGGSSLSNAARALMNANSFLTEMVAYLYLGSLDAAAYVGAKMITGGPLVGTGATNLPGQTSLVASWRAGAGASRRGRTYLPANGAGLDGAGREDSTVVDNVVDGFESFYNSLGIAACQPIVVSPTLQSASVVQDLIVDNKPDVMRRRVDHLASTHTASHSGEWG